MWIKKLKKYSVSFSSFLCEEYLYLTQKHILVQRWVKALMSQTIKITQSANAHYNMHVENERSLVFGENGGCLAFAHLSHFCTKAQSIQTPPFILPVLHVQAICSLMSAQQRHLFTPTLEGAFFICNGLVLPPLVSTHRDIWPFPLSAPWRASASPLTWWCLGWE